MQDNRTVLRSGAMATSRFDEKLAEARYFLTRMRAEISNPDLLPVTANLRACVGAGRSVVLYAEENAFEVANGRPAKRGELGKDAAVQRLRTIHQAEPVLTFFQRLRNNDVHVKPTGSLKKVAHTITAVAVYAGIESDPAEVTFYTLSLDEWPDPGPDALSLCEKYIAQIERFLADAAAQGLIRR